MKISIIFPNRNIGRKKSLDAVTPPLGLAYLAAVLEKNNFEVNIIDAFCENISFKKLLKKLSAIKPDVIGITTNVDIILHSLWTAKILKKQFKKAKIVLGGPYATELYEFLLKYKFVDFIVLGEGEDTFLELVKNLKENKSVDSVKGIAFRSQGRVIKTSNRPFIEDLDQLPFPAWHLFPNLAKYKYFTLTSRAVPILTSRGCPYRCIFCSKCIHGHRVRFRTPENVFEEIKYLKDKYSIKEFGIIDDHFGFDSKRAIELCDLIINSNLNLKLILANGIRADVVTPKLVYKLRKAGCWFIGIGIESGNQTVLNKIGKGVTLSQIKKSIEICKQYGMLTTGYFIIGLPHANRNTINETISFAKNSKLDLAIFNMAVPVPGTKMFELVETHGKFAFPFEDRYLVGMNTQYEGPYFEIWNLKKEDVIFGHKRAFREFYFRPTKIVSLLSKIHSRRQLIYILTYFKNIFLSK